ncbi:MAG: hypothetical protein GY847_37635 [Proteobacteria bacterium]|nr:hypothetical protein [Pseudomonadota bacterium]
MKDNDTTRETRPIVSDLFSIDVDSEIRKLCNRRFRAKGESILELVSFGMGLDPEQIDIEIGRYRLVVHCRGVVMDNSIPEWLASIFNPSRSEDLRHKALVELEREHGLGLLAAFAEQPSKVILEWVASGRCRGIVFKAGRPPQSFDPNRPDGLKIVITRRRHFLKKEIHLIEKSCRYATVPMRLNSRQVNTKLHLDNCLIQKKLKAAGTRGAVGVPKEGDLLRITLLKRGVVREEVVRPALNGLVLSAVVEDRNDDIGNIVNELQNEGIKLYAKLAANYDDLSENTKQRVLDLLFDHCRYSGNKQLLCGVHAFLQVNGPPLDLPGVLEAAGRGVLYAIDMDARLNAYEISGRPVLMIDQRQRKFLGQEPRLELTTPPRRACRAGFKIRISTQLRSAGEWISRFSNRRPGRPIPDEQLDPEERAFIEAVRTEIASGAFLVEDFERSTDKSVSMVSGRQCPWIRKRSHSGSDVYCIARSHTLVKAMVAKFAESPLYLYPTLVSLTQGHDGSAANRKATHQAIIDHKTIL